MASAFGADGSDGRWKKSRRLLVALCVALLLVSGGAWLFARVSVRTRAAAVRAELAQDFPGFDSDKVSHFSDVGSFDSGSQSGFNFEMSYRATPAFKVIGIYYLTGLVVGSGEQVGSFEGTIFNGRRFSDVEVAAFAAQWVRQFPGQAVLVGVGAPPREAPLRRWRLTTLFCERLGSGQTPAMPTPSAPMCQVATHCGSSLIAPGGKWVYLGTSATLGE